MKEKKQEKNLEEKLEELDLEKILEKRAKKKRRLIFLIVTIIIITFSAFVTYNHFYGNKGYIKADIKVSSSSKLYSNSEPENSEDIGEGALFILYIDGIKRDDFLAEYEVQEITINGEKTDINKLIYRHLNNALSKTTSPLVVTFDADMIPMHNFLTACVPYFFIENEEIGFIQTPQSFYNPDLFQYNLFSYKVYLYKLQL